jgi:hypothetical protein
MTNIKRQRCPLCGKGITMCYCGSFDNKSGQLRKDVVEYREWRNKERNKGHEVPPNPQGR